MIKVVRVTFECQAQFDARREMFNAIESHMVQIYKKSLQVGGYHVVEMSPDDIEAAARADLAISMDELTKSLNRYRIEGKLT